MVTREDESLIDMLLYAKISELPDEYDGSKVWAQAIVKLKRKSGCEDYVIAEHDLFSWEEINVKKESPNRGIPHSVVAIYPYLSLGASDTPDVETKEDIINFISQRERVERDSLIGLDNDTLKKRLLNICIKEKISRFNGRKTTTDYMLGVEDPENPTESKAIDKSAASEVDTEMLDESPKRRGRKPKTENDGN